MKGIRFKVILCYQVVRVDMTRLHHGLVHIQSVGAGDGEEPGEELETKWCDMEETVLQVKEPFAAMLNQEIDKVSFSFHGA